MAEEAKQIGEITHYFSHLGVGIFKFNRAVKVGEKIHIKGATSDCIQAISSMQYDHKDIGVTKKGQEVGIKIDEKVREGDKVYEALE